MLFNSSSARLMTAWFGRGSMCPLYHDEHGNGHQACNERST